MIQDSPELWHYIKQVKFTCSSPYNAREKCNQLTIASRDLLLVSPKYEKTKIMLILSQLT